VMIRRHRRLTTARRQFSGGQMQVWIGLGLGDGKQGSARNGSFRALINSVGREIILGRTDNCIVCHNLPLGESREWARVYRSSKS